MMITEHRSLNIKRFLSRHKKELRIRYIVGCFVIVNKSPWPYPSFGILGTLMKQRH